MRAGQPCLVHSVGGLKDTVEHNVSGFCFNGDTLSTQADALLQSLTEALSLYQTNPKQWQAIKRRAADARFSWDSVVTDYITYLY